MISFTKEEIEKNRQESLEAKLSEDASMEVWFNGKDKNKTYEDEDEEDDAIIDHLNANRERLEKEFIRNTQTGTHHCHEAMENVSRIMNQVESICEQSSIIANPEWYAMAHEAHTLLFNLYQEIGAQHLEAIPNNMVEMVEEQKRKNREKEENGTEV